jgi:hypothetical protein
MARTGDYTSLRLFFATLWANECNGDFSPTTITCATLLDRVRRAAYTLALQSMSDSELSTVEPFDVAAPLDGVRPFALSFSKGPF